MSPARRDVLLALGGTVVGAAASLGTDREVQTVESRSPLPFYGTAVSAVRPDRSRPRAGQGVVVWSGSRTPGDRRVALTFDDGPDPDWTPRVLASLARYDAPATFFVRGDHLRAHPGVHARSLDAGHELANHTWDHPDLGRLPLAQVQDQLARTSAELTRVTGRAPVLFRPPYGHLGGSTLLAAAETGLTCVLWSTQMHEDAWVGHPDRVVPGARELVAAGDVVLAHDSGSPDRLTTIDHLDGILAALRADGHDLVTVTDLLVERPVSHVTR
ncbi:polysaccharide deacetylase family protein [Lapillicoccus jejuensis]|uniref:Peptidoglycan/xylan/chitin deacetylase (PgdA/CDA1 family) n=1 Tax=Lapillicoccus jejuensis TaxID=402171 RepID=A0A542E2T9_9MICO|nr:polysaccharide deacetylase family protein [Lapillicoccus jejuensis]TQJ09645.1 peptidoglycan/xylan/chitin deacetylase (PgdA/CDA1 family) [Lapillicoccus jejuensis]